MKPETKLTIGQALAGLGKPKKRFHLPVDHKPYMVLPRGVPRGGFSCSHCVFLRTKIGGFHCSSPDYKLYFNHTLLTDEDGKTPLDDPGRACSDWFRPTGR
jgi:hypothetical protein